MSAVLKPKISLSNFNDKPKMESFNDMLNFDTPDGSNAKEISLNSLVSFPEHKFKLYSGQQLTDMVESIQILGVIMPLIVWHKENEYIILSGHNRANAARLAGLTTVPCIVKASLTLEEATLIVTETNLRQRSFTDLSHSERAFCLVQHYEALKSQGKRNDLVSEIEKLMDIAENPNCEAEGSGSEEKETPSRNDEKLSENYGLSRTNVARYLRLGNNLSVYLFKLLDDEILGFLTAYELSFLDEPAQSMLCEALETNGYPINTKKAQMLRTAFEEGKLTSSRIVFILAATEEKSEKIKTIHLKPKFLSRYFNEQQSAEDIEQTIEEALEEYFENHDTISE